VNERSAIRWREVGKEGLEGVDWIGQVEWART
jgi:hypothetical protein